MAKREIERTCKRDGTVWYVPLKEARERPDNALLRFGYNAQAVGSRASLFGKDSVAELQLSNMHAKDQRIARNARCPSCSSSSYTERRVRV